MSGRGVCRSERQWGKWWWAWSQDWAGTAPGNDGGDVTVVASKKNMIPDKTLTNRTGFIGHPQKNTSLSIL